MNNWAVRVLNEWQEECNKRCWCPSDCLERPADETLNLWLARFVVESRRADGYPYPPTTITNLLSGLYQFARNCITAIIVYGVSISGVTIVQWPHPGCYFS